MTLVPRCVICDRTSDPIAVIDSDMCCKFCALKENGPGRFEKYSHYHIERTGSYNDYIDDEDADYEDLGKVIILQQWSQDGDEDEYMSNEGWGYCGLFGSYLLFIDTQGFITFEEYPNEPAAGKRYTEIFDDGMGADEDDAYISSDGWRYEASFGGKDLEVQKRTRDKYGENLPVTFRRCLAAIRLESFKTGYYPNVWSVSDHGNISLIKEL